MKIFILDKFKITKFNLPEKIEDSFLVPYSGYNNKNDNFVTIEAKDDKWTLKSNGNVNIVDGTNLIDNVVLEDYSYYSLKVLGQQEYATLFSLPSREQETYKLAINNLTSITIGSAQNTTISYRNALTAEIHAEIKFVNNEWYLAGSADDTYRTYINGERVITAKLDVGDVIFINGLKIIWMKTFIKINNPRQCVSVTGLSAYEELEIIDNTKYTPVTDEEANVDLYSENEYFYHMPRLVPTIESFEIEIDPPPAAEKNEETPALLTIGSSITMASSSVLMGFTIIQSISSGQKSWLQSLPQIITLAVMIFSSILLPRIAAGYQKRRKKRKEKERQTKYKAYLDKMNVKVQNALKQQSQILRENNLSSKECYDVIMNKNRLFWSREIADEDFLKIRLGIGNTNSFISLKAPQEHFTLDEDNLQELVFNVDKNSKKLENVPITINLVDQTSLAFIMNCSYRRDYINGIMTQILALHSATELKIVILTDKDKESQWEYAKFLPHCWSDDKTIRFFATNSDEYKEVSNYIETEFRKRTDRNNKEETETIEQEDRQKPYKNNTPYYLIITDSYKSVKSLGLFDLILRNSINYGFTLLMISDSIKSVSNKCEKFIGVGEKQSAILEKKINSQLQTEFTNEYDKTIDMNKVSSKISNVPLLTKDAISSLPTSLSFLEMYGVGKIEHLNILNRWQNNNPVTSLSTPIGVHADGELFKLDLHEKFHGPHGLIAGSTGSGKSEFIITYILSMCVNYHPYEVQFVLIDYKGGGLAGAFENKESGVKVPHLVGTITNLDTAEMNRTLVSISSELKRRQKKFNEVKDKLDESTMDIYKYQKFYREGLIDEPMAHLFIISDEFAELKSQQPEFLNELVSTARIGRSLGVHLILATQKPSGVVNDQIWSNSKFKICLKVQDKSDSMEMLKRPEAASIKETGRFYLQVGYDDYFDIGQSGWGGAKYVPTDRIVRKVDDSISFVGNVGNIIKSINDVGKKETTEDLGEQLTNLVKFIYNLAKKENIITRKMWLDKIPNEIFISDVKNKYQYKPEPYYINPLIGEYDNPAAQEQGVLNLDLSKNTLIYGQGGSGKENLLTTILWSSSTEHTPDEVNFYIIDCGAETLKMFYKFPHVGEVCTIDESDKIIDTLTLISDLVESRKEKYVDYGGNYKGYCDNSGSKDPLIVVIINNYEVFSETYGKVTDSLDSLYRDGEKYGITFILSCTTTSGVRGRTVQYFKNKIAFQLSDAGDYRNLLNGPRNLAPAKNFGRGLSTFKEQVFEFQTANITTSKELVKTIKSAADQLNSAYTTRAKRLPSVPDVVSIDLFKEDISTITSIPIGYDMTSKQKIDYNFIEEKFNIILSNDIVNQKSFISALIKEMSLTQDTNVRVVDFKNMLTENYDNVVIYRENFDNAIVQINNEIAASQNSQKNNYYILLGAGEYKNKLTEASCNIFNNICLAAPTLKNTFFILSDSYSTYRNLQLESWYQSQVDATNGLWLGPDIGNQNSLTINDMDLEHKKLVFDDMAFAISQGEYLIIKHVVDEVMKNEE